MAIHDSTGGRCFFVVAALLSAVLLGALLSPGCRANGSFDFKRQIWGSPGTLSLFSPVADASTGETVLNGVDSSQPTNSFTWDWGDGTITQGFFPGHHTYADTLRNYVITVTAHYAGGGSDTATAVVWFVAPTVQPIPLPQEHRVTVPTSMVDLTSRMPGYGFSANLTAFDDTFFPTISRSTVEYVLWAAASLQARMANEDVFPVAGSFQQVLLRDPAFGGMYSLWYTTPVAFGVGDFGFIGSLQWSSFMHEMGHNTTLNFPSAYYYGGKIDGNANAIYSETMAQIFQHATIYELMNAPQHMGISDALADEIAKSGCQTISVLRQAYDDYFRASRPFASWNDPTTPEDETFGTFMALGFTFCEQAERAGKGYMIPCRRMMRLLSLFDAGMREKYDQWHDTPEAAIYRSTLLAAAFSYGFQKDLRAEFRNLNCPVDDAAYRGLYQRAAWADARRVLIIAAGLQTVSEEEIAALDVEPSTDKPPRLDLQDAIRLVRQASGLDIS